MAKTISCVYENEIQLNSYIKEHELSEYPNLLIQVFSGVLEKVMIRSALSELKALLPKAKVVGCTTSGEISDGYILENQLLLSFTIFEKTELNSILLELDSFNNSFEMGKELATKLTAFDTKAIILFPTNLDINVPLLLEGVYTVNPDLVVTGGVAGDNGKFEKSYSFEGDKIIENGVAAVALSGEHLTLQTNTNYKWQEIGKSFTVTNAKESTIYSIDHKKPIQILRQYLGDLFVDTLPQSGVELPFLLEKEGESVSVFIIKLLKNGAIKVNRAINEGDKLTFAYADIKAIVEESIQEMKRIVKTPVETIFVYNCMARKKFMRDFTEEELRMLNSIGSAVGFFSYGEIWHKKDRSGQLVGHSLTYLALSESTTVTKKIPTTSFKYEIPDHLNTIVSLTHLMQASQQDNRLLNDHLKVSEQYYKSLFDNNDDFVYSTDMTGHFTSVNQAFIKTFGFSKKEIIGTSALKYINDEDIPRVRMHFYRAAKGKEQYYNIEIPSKSGEINLFQIRNIPITVNGKPVGIYGIGRNITEQRKIEEKIIQLAYYDQDTGLPNRMKFTEKLEEMLGRAKKKKRMLAVVSIDMDRFKIINDSLGHFAGDVILKQVSERIQNILPAGSFLGRFGGDKFTLILSKNINMDEVMKTSKLILQHLAKPIFYKNQEFFVTASIGVSLFPGDGLDEHALLKNADIAVNRSKNQGGNRITFYSNEMNEEAIIRLELESYLRKALFKDEFYLCYQPLVDLASGKVYGSEALIRWQHPKLGLVSPGEFIPLAEETGLIEDIGNWVLRTACKQNKKWQELGFGDLTISVNVSPHQFQQYGFINEVKNALWESGLEPEYLTLELTESTMLRNIDYSISVMKELQQIGVKVSIDDFGTGYSSLSYLRNLPINTLKIDRSFINNLSIDTSDIAIVKAIITMGHGLSVKVVAEGVETKEQIELLKELKCHYAQGFYIHRPLMTSDFEKGLLETVHS